MIAPRIASRAARRVLGSSIIPRTAPSASDLADMFDVSRVAPSAADLADVADASRVADVSRMAPSAADLAGVRRISTYRACSSALLASPVPVAPNLPSPWTSPLTRLTQTRGSQFASGFSMPQPKRLEEIMSVDALRACEADEVAAMWNNHHLGRTHVSTVISAAAFETLQHRAKVCPMFVLPVAGSKGFVTMLAQVTAITPCRTRASPFPSPPHSPLLPTPLSSPLPSPPHSPLLPTPLSSPLPSPLSSPLPSPPHSPLLPIPLSSPFPSPPHSPLLPIPLSSPFPFPPHSPLHPVTLSSPPTVTALCLCYQWQEARDLSPCSHKCEPLRCTLPSYTITLRIVAQLPPRPSHVPLVVVIAQMPRLLFASLED
ncbi:unnamed protein product [Closterium sp. NIES-65]|nr:unnamed protein product [Closterium sp. NIES-65]